MCGRYFLLVDIKKLQKRYGIDDQNINYELESSGEIYPTNNVPAILENNDEIIIESLKWGFAPSYFNRVVINSRAETIEEKKLFKNAFFKQRCLIPANYFFEWKKSGDKKKKYKISVKDREIFSFAAIYKKFKTNSEEYVNHFSIITTEANKKIRKIHNRMPVILNKKDEKKWLNPNNNNKLNLKNLVKIL